MIDEELLGTVIGKFVSSYKGQVDVSVVNVEKEQFTVRFSGALCRKCGPEDYIDAFAYLLKLNGMNAQYIGLKEEKGFFYVTYALY